MIVRELLVKLGFNIDNAGLEKFNTLIERTKDKMQSIKDSSRQSISTIGGTRLADAISPKTEFSKPKQGIRKSYVAELAALPKHERDDIEALNRKELAMKPKYQFAAPLTKEALNRKERAMKPKYQFAAPLTKKESLTPRENTTFIKEERQALKATTQMEKVELKERYRVAKEFVQEKLGMQRLEERSFKTSLVSMSRVARKFAVIGASISAAFGLSLRATLNDVSNFKEGKSTSTFDPKQISIVDDFNRALLKTKSSALQLRNSFIIDLLPPLKETLEVFNSWINKNKVLIKDRLSEIVVALGGAFQTLSSVVGQIASVLNFAVRATVGWRAVITAVLGLGVAAWFIALARSISTAVIAFKALTVAMVTNPVVGVVLAIVAALALLVEEIYLTISGGDTLISRIMESGAWATCKDGIDGIVNSLKDMWKWIIKAKDGVMNFPSNVTTQIKGSLNIQTAKNSEGGQHMVKHDAMVNPIRNYMPMNTINPYKYTPESAKSSVINNAKSATMAQQNTFNMTINVPVGTSQEQAKEFAKIARAQIEKHQTFQMEKMQAAIGSY